MKKTLILVGIFGLALIGTVKASALTVSPVRLELSLDPGQTYNGEVQVINEETELRTVYSSFENFEAEGETGRPVFTDDETGLASWMSTTEAVTINPSEKANIPFTVEVPANATPGGYFAAMFWGSETPDSALEASDAVQINSKIGILFLLRVNGEIDEEGDLLGLSTSDGRRLYSTRPTEFEYRFQNEGSDRVKPEGDLQIKRLIGTKATLDANNSEGNVLPASVRRFIVDWPLASETAYSRGEKSGFFAVAGHQWRNFAFGPYNASLDLEYGFTDSVSAEATYRFWVIPYQLLIIILVGGGILVCLLRRLLRSYNRWIIAQARQAMEKKSS